MTKNELIQAFAEMDCVETETAAHTLSVLMSIISETLIAGEEVTLPGLGKLKVVDRPARVGTNPTTRVKMDIEAKRVVKFSPSAAFNLDMQIGSD